MLFILQVTQGGIVTATRSSALPAKAEASSLAAQRYERNWQSG